MTTANHIGETERELRQAGKGKPVTGRPICCHLRGRAGGTLTKEGTKYRHMKGGCR